MTGSRRLGETPYRSTPYRFEKHSLSLYHYEKLEDEQEFEDKRRFGEISYLDFLDRIDNGTIKPKELGMKL